MAPHRKEDAPIRHFTVALYKRMQVQAYLRLVLEADTVDEDVAKETRSHLSRSLTLLRPLMLKHLPPGIAAALYPAEDAPPCLNWDHSVREAADTWRAAWEADWDRACRVSHETFLSIKDALPKALQQFRETFSLHDARFISVNMAEKDTLVLTMDCRGCLTHTGRMELRFHGVGSAENLAPGLAGGVWLYDELELTADGVFDWKALVEGYYDQVPEGADLALHEIRIVARSFEFRHSG